MFSWCEWGIRQPRFQGLSLEKCPWNEVVIKSVLACHTVAMVTCCVTKMITTYSSMVGQYFDTIIVASSDQEWL